MSFWGKKGDDMKGSEQSGGIKPQTNTATSSPTNTFAPIIPTTASSKTDDERYGKVRSALGPGTIIQGKLSFDSTVSIDGKLTGEIFSSKTLLVGPSGLVDAHIDVASLIIKGTVKGVVRATERVEICEGGQLLGDVSTPSLVIQEGCVFSGNCVMSQDKDKSKTAQPKPTQASSPTEEKEIVAKGTEAPQSVPGLH